MAAMLLCFALAGCADGRGDSLAMRRLPQSGDYIFGAIVSDEPSATIAARSILIEGGTAADAAVGLYFALAVTAPSVASIGGGGVCLVHNPVSGKVDVLDFLAPATAHPMPGARPLAIPTAVRGMAALHGRYGRLPWDRVLLEAEKLSRSGFTVTRQLAGDLQRAGDRILADPGARREFSDSDGRHVRVGDPVRRIELGSVIGQIRGRGAGAFYSGPLADRVIEGARRAGGSLSAEEMRAYLPKWRLAVSTYFGRDQMHVAGPPAIAGLVAAQMWQMLVADKRYINAAADERWHLVVETARRALATGGRLRELAMDDSEIASRHLSEERIRELMADYDPAAAGPPNGMGAPAAVSAGSGFTVVDGSGMAVVCTVTPYTLFGIGRMAPGTGIFHAPAPSYGSGPDSLGLMMVTRPSRKTVSMAVATGGSFAGATAMAHLAAQIILERLPLAKAIAGVRVHPDPAGSRVLAEAGAKDAHIDALSRRGHLVQRDQVLGRLNAVYCPKGLPAADEDESDCNAAADPRGGGLSRVFLFQKE